MDKLDYRQSQGDHPMFYKHERERRMTVLIVHMDDIILIRNDIYEMESLKSKLAVEFEIKNLSNLTYFLGIEVEWSKWGIFIS